VASAERGASVNGSPLAVHGENVILGRHFRMTREATIDDAGGIGLERVGRWIIVKHGVCPCFCGAGYLLVSFSMGKMSCRVSGILTEKWASVLFFGFHSIFAILEPSGKVSRCRERRLGNGPAFAAHHV
jgi:hypothetical protein